MHHNMQLVYDQPEEEKTKNKQPQSESCHLQDKEKQEIVQKQIQQSDRNEQQSNKLVEEASSKRQKLKQDLQSHHSEHYYVNQLLKSSIKQQIFQNQNPLVFLDQQQEKWQSPNIQSQKASKQIDNKTMTRPPTIPSLQQLPVLHTDTGSRYSNIIGVSYNSPNGYEEEPFSPIKEYEPTSITPSPRVIKVQPINKDPSNGSFFHMREIVQEQVGCIQGIIQKKSTCCSLVFHYENEKADITIERKSFTLCSHFIIALNGEHIATVHSNFIGTKYKVYVRNKEEAVGVIRFRCCGLYREIEMSVMEGEEVVGRVVSRVPQMREDKLVLDFGGKARMSATENAILDMEGAEKLMCAKVKEDYYYLRYRKPIDMVMAMGFVAANLDSKLIVQ